MAGRWAALALALCLALSGCTAGRPERVEIQFGGTLHLGLVGALRLDPADAVWPAELELLRCCLLRTLVSYPGRPAERGGTQLRPDLAEALPEISSDGLRWTFRLKTGLRYSPPFEETPITAMDVVRALEYQAREDAPFADDFGVIEGFEGMRQGTAGSISGLRTPDPLTLEISLLRPAGDLGHLLALPAAAPMPEEALAEGSAFSLPASGPYVVAGAAAPDLPPSDQLPAWFRPDRSVTLLRNPSWRRDADPLRPAYPDRIEVVLSSSRTDLARLVDAGDVQLQLDAAPPPEQIRKYSLDPQLGDEFFARPSGGVRFVSLWAFDPPFDDVHVRRAVALALDKEELRRLSGGSSAGRIAGHLFPDELLGDGLQAFDPLATVGHRGEPERARKEMRRSAYDANGDGLCDAEACRSVPAFYPFPELEPQAASVAEDLSAIGLDLELQPVAPEEIPAGPGAGLSLHDPARPGYPDPGALAVPLLGGTGAKIEEARACDALWGAARLDCWVRLDRRLTVGAEVIPYLFENNIDVVSDDVINYTIDQSTGLAAVARIALAGGREST